MKQELKAALEKAKHVHDLMHKMILNVPWFTEEDEERFFKCMWAAHDELMGLVKDIKRLYERLDADDNEKLPPELKV